METYLDSFTLSSVVTPGFDPIGYYRLWYEITLFCVTDFFCFVFSNLLNASSLVRKYCFVFAQNLR